MAFNTVSAKFIMSDRDRALAAAGVAALAVAGVVVGAAVVVSAAAASVLVFLPRKGLRTLVTIWSQNHIFLILRQTC